MNASEVNTSAACRPEEAAAYLDGELSAEATTHFEQHAHACPRCATALNEQRRLLCMLEAAFGAPLTGQPALPRDFSRVVRARAQSDMSRVRTEKKRALLLCAALAALAFALLGGQAFALALAPVRGAGRALLAALDVLGHTLMETGRGAVLILRALTAQLTSESGGFRVLIFFGLTGALVLLLRLINSYHRTRIPD
jgi:anti-sigma factor RsiW